MPASGLEKIEWDGKRAILNGNTPLNESQFSFRTSRSDLPNCKRFAI